MGLHLDEKYMSTLGVDLASHKHVDEDIELTFQIWDLGGQKEYRKLRKKQYVGSEGGLLVFDKSRPETFASLSEWLNEIDSSLHEKIPIFLLGNKDDLMGKEQNELLDNQARVFLEKNRNTYKHLEMIEYYSTCALTGSNVFDAFLDLGRIIVRKKSDAMKI